MTESAFLAGVAAYLGGAGLDPALTVGTAEPTAVEDLPVAVLSLEDLARANAGIGDKSELVTGALAVAVAIDLANPVLPGDTESLLTPDRTGLTLPHGGLVRDDGSSGELSSADLAVAVDGVARTLVASTTDPGASQFTADPAVGQLTFGAALPAAGELAASYFLGIWERSVVQLGGILTIEICTAEAASATALSTVVVDAMLAPAARTEIQRLVSIGLQELGSVGAVEPQFANCRRRKARFSFEFEHQINQPESSGGVIQRIPVDTGLRSVSVSAAGAIEETTIIETS